MIQPIKVNYKSTSSAYTANKWLRSLPDLIACDFEAAVKYSPAEITAMQAQLEDDTLTTRDRIIINSCIQADALSHPAHVDLTHFQVAWSDSEAYVFILDNKRIRDLVLNFLVSTTRRQIWHNATFDFKHIYYHTNKFPIEYEDTQILAKTILNHVEIHKAKTGLKELAGAPYGSWAISADMFTKEQMYNEDVLRYSATDPCATFWLWNSIQKHIKGQSCSSNATP